jgi:hypothetical protein
MSNCNNQNEFAVFLEENALWESAHDAPSSSLGVDFEALAANSDLNQVPGQGIYKALRTFRAALKVPGKHRVDFLTASSWMRKSFWLIAPVGLAA